LDVSGNDRTSAYSSLKESHLSPQRLDSFFFGLKRALSESTWPEDSMFALLYDLRFSFRMIGRNPAFSIVGIVTLAVGIGAGTTVFSWLDSVPL
jgi:hypothetical protein